MVLTKKSPSTMYSCEIPLSLKILSSRLCSRHGGMSATQLTVHHISVHSPHCTLSACQPTQLTVNHIYQYLKHPSVICAKSKKMYTNSTDYKKHDWKLRKLFSYEVFPQFPESKSPNLKLMQKFNLDFFLILKFLHFYNDSFLKGSLIQTFLKLKTFSNSLRYFESRICLKIIKLKLFPVF